MAWETPWAQHQGPPRIDLLPKELATQRVVRRWRGGIAAGFLVLLALLGLWYTLESRELAKAKDQADQERKVATGLRAQRVQLQPLADLEAQIDAADELKASVYRREIRFSGVMRDISTIVPDDVWLTSMSVAFSDNSKASGGGGSSSSTQPSGASGASGASAAVTPGSPGAGSPVASITFAGAGLEHVDVGGLLRALARGPKKGGQPVYQNPYFTTSSQTASEGGQTTVTFSATVDLSSAAYSGRFQPAGIVTP
jgi:hypothetical protein